MRAQHPGDDARIARVSLVDEAGGRHVRMAHLAAVGSHAVNGVAALHTDLLKQTVMRDFHELFPERFLNVTNGVTPRRWVALCNPGLAALITEAIGDGWLRDAEHGLAGLEAFADDAAFRRALAGGQARQQGPPGGTCSANGRASSSTPIPSSTCRSSACTSTSGST